MVTMIGRRPNPTPPRPPRAWACRGTASFCCWRPRRRPRWSVWASRVCCCRGRPSRRRGRGWVVVSPAALRAGDEGEPDDAETDADELAHRLDHAGLFAARRARRRLASTGADGSRDLSAVAEVAPDHARRVWRSGRPCGRISGHPSMRHRRARPDRATHRRRGHRCCHVSRDAISAALGPMSGRAVRPSRLKRGGQTGWATGVGRNRTT